MLEGLKGMGMVKVQDAVIARLEREGEKFEILVDPDLALELKKGSKVNFDELLAIDRVFRDAKKGEEASSEAVMKRFGTDNVSVIATQIICEGEVQLTTDQKRRMLEQRRREVVSLISRNAINPQSNAPHPPQRIENAMEEAKVQVDLFRPARDQVPGILKEIRKLIPISMEEISLAAKISAEFAGKAEFVMHKYGIKKQEWQKDGSLIIVVSIPAGMRGEVIGELNHLTHGNVETKIIPSAS